MYDEDDECTWCLADLTGVPYNEDNELDCPTCGNVNVKWSYWGPTVNAMCGVPRERIQSACCISYVEVALWLTGTRLRALIGNRR